MILMPQVSLRAFIVGGSFLILIVLVGAAVAFRGSKIDGLNFGPNLAPSDASSQDEKEDAITLPKADIGKLYDNITQTCFSSDDHCYNEGLKTITAEFGPVAALDVLSTLEENHLIQATTDDHQLAHAIGRKTAERFGIHGQGFLLCPTTFNYGCQHGFFEYALGKANSTKEVINQICGAFETNPNYSAKFKFYCYHGVGHGVMMAEAYDLASSIAVCDSLDSMIAIEGCWQGVFMENVNAGMRGEARDGVFSKLEPLAPCSNLEQKYRHECFINHAGWLMQIFSNSVRDASSACMKAPSGSIDSCMQSIGLMVTNPVWQAVLANPPAGGLSPGESSESIAWQLCLEFPSAYQEQCLLGAVDNILNFDELKVTRAGSFCALVQANWRDSCYRRIGSNLRAQVTDQGKAHDGCSTFAPHERDLCLMGAGIQ